MEKDDGADWWTFKIVRSEIRETRKFFELGGGVLHQLFNSPSVTRSLKHTSRVMQK